jgi:DNA-binding LacI/PurR family transcriptional regulator
MKMDEFIFLINSEKDALNQANLLHSIIKSKWDKIIVYIYYTDDTIENYNLKDDKYIIINSKYNLYIVSSV